MCVGCPKLVKQAVDVSRAWKVAAANVVSRRELGDQIEDRHEHDVFALEGIEELVRGGGRGHHYLSLVGEYKGLLAAGERGQTGDHFLAHGTTWRSRSRWWQA